MGKLSRRRLGLAAPLVLAHAASASSVNAAAAPTLSSSHLGNPAASSSHLGSPLPPSQHLATAFSCGVRWAASQTCATLCPSGRDADCPDGEACYGGIPCSHLQEGAGFGNMEEVLAEQDRLEREEVNRLRKERAEGYVERFVCGASYQDAESSCGAVVELNAVGTKGVDAAGGVAAFYCPRGSARQCPPDLECYAAVPCPRSTHEEEPPLINAASARALNSLATEPLLLQASGAVINATFFEDAVEAPRLAAASEVSMLGALSSLLSPRSGLN